MHIVYPKMAYQCHLKIIFIKTLKQSFHKNYKIHHT